MATSSRPALSRPGARAWPVHATLKAEAALEVYELLSLEERRTGRFGENPAWDRVQEDVTKARDAVDASTIERAASRARAVPVARRGDRVIEIARAAAQS